MFYMQYMIYRAFLFILILQCFIGSAILFEAVLFEKRYLKYIRKNTKGLKEYYQKRNDYYLLYNSLNINRDLYFIKGLFDKCEKETNQYYIEQSGIESMSEEEIKKDINILIALKNSEIELKALKRVALRNASVLSLKYKKSHLLPLSLLFHKEERLQFNLNMVNDIYGFKIQINYVSKVGKRYYHYNYNISYDTVIHILNQILENKGLKTN